MRIQAIKSLRDHGIMVDCYGSHTRPISNKLDTLRNYQYSLSFENTYTPGYVTEKIVDSFIGITCPIYWGGAPKEIFNLQQHFICNPYDTVYNNIEHFIQWKSTNTDNIIPPLLLKGGFEKTESSIIFNLARIFLDLF